MLRPSAELIHDTIIITGIKRARTGQYTVVKNTNKTQHVHPLNLMLPHTYKPHILPGGWPGQVFIIRGWLLTGAGRAGLLAPALRVGLGLLER